MEELNVVVFLGKLIGPTYYARRFVDYLIQKGISHYIVDVNLEESYNCKAFTEYTARPNTVMLTFNNVGIKLQAKNGNNFWKEMRIPVFDYIVDHPRNYDDVMLDPPCELNVFALDLDHVDFINRYYPKVNVFFSPNGGTEVNSKRPIKERSLDVIYMGDCNRKVTTFPVLKGFEDDGNEFYSWCVVKLVEDPMCTTERAIDLFFQENGYVSNEQTLYTLKSNVSGYIESYVRRYFKLEGIKALDKAGVSVDIYGSRWEDEEYPFSDNIRIHDRVARDVIMELVGNAKISLCFIPWFKRGCSEKNFDSMLNGALCVTDRSDYLDKNYKDGDNIIFFDLNNPDQMANDVKWLLNNPDSLERIASQGYHTCQKYDTWNNRFDFVTKVISETILLK